MAHKPLPCPSKISCQVDVEVPDLIMQLQHDKLKVSYGSAFGEGFPSASTTAFLLSSFLFLSQRSVPGSEGDLMDLFRGGHSFMASVLACRSV